MHKFINLLGKRYNTDQIFKYESNYWKNNPIILVTFIDGSVLDISFDDCLTRDRFIQDMDRKLVIPNG